MKDYLIFLALALGLSIILYRWFSWRLMGKVRSMAAYLQNIDPNKMEEVHPLALEAREKSIQAMAQGINDLIHRTQLALRNIRKMSRYVAHELRNPLTILQGEAETVILRENPTKEDYERVLKSSLEEVQRISATIDTILLIGEFSEKQIPIQREALDLRTWIAQEKGKWERSLGREITLVEGAKEPIKVRTHPRLLFQLMDNIVRNIRKHGGKDCRCWIQPISESKRAVVKIWDDGPGMDSGEMEPLNRWGFSPHHLGIGLQLCHTIGELLGARMVFSKSAEGGLQVEVILKRMKSPQQNG